MDVIYNLTYFLIFNTFALVYLFFYLKAVFRKDSSSISYQKFFSKNLLYLLGSFVLTPIIQIIISTFITDPKTRDGLASLTGISLVFIAIFISPIYLIITLIGSLNFFRKNKWMSIFIALAFLMIIPFYYIVLISIEKY